MNSAFLSHRTSLIVVMLVALLAACSGGPKVRVDQASKANFASYKTFAWVESKPADAGEPKQPGDALASERARAAVIASLQAKGYSLDEAHPDVRVSCVLNVYERPKQSGLSIGVGAGGGSGNVAGGVGVSLPVGKRNETVGAMTVDVFDASRNAPVWHGSGEMIVPVEGTSDADVQKLTDAVLAKYPARVQ